MSPEPSPAACGGLQHPGVELRAIQGLGSPRSILALLFPALGMVGELPCPHPTVQTWGCSASPLTVLPTSVPLSEWVLRLLWRLLQVSPRSPGPRGMQGYNSPLSGAALMGKLESLLGEGEWSPTPLEQEEDPWHSGGWRQRSCSSCGTIPKPPGSHGRQGCGHCWQPR